MASAAIRIVGKAATGPAAVLPTRPESCSDGRGGRWGRRRGAHIPRLAERQLRLVGVDCPRASDSSEAAAFIGLRRGRVAAAPSLRPRNQRGKHKSPKISAVLVLSSASARGGMAAGVRAPQRSSRRCYE